MLSLSSKKSLLSGVSAVVLATTVGVSAVGVSGALAQAVDYTHSTGTKVWANNPSERTAGNNGDLTNARADDNLTLEGGVVGFSDTSVSGRRRIGILRGGTSGAGQFIVRGNNVHIDGTIGEIGKPGDHAVNLLIGSNGSSLSAVRSSLSVTRNAVVNDLEIDVSGFTNDGSQGRATFNGNLTVEGTTQIKAGNSPVSPINAILKLKGAQNKFAQDITLNDQASGNTYFSVRELRILSGQKTAGWWGRFWASLIFVAPYLIMALSILVVSFVLNLRLDCSLPSKIGGILLSLEGLLLTFYIRPDTTVLDTFNLFSRRLKKMGVGKFTDRAKIQDDFLERERYRGRFLTRFTNATGIFIFFAGILINLFDIV